MKGLAQKKDNFDSDVDHRGWKNLNDPTTVGMYDDQTVYSEPGKAGKVFGGKSAKQKEGKE